MTVLQLPPLSAENARVKLWDELAFASVRVHETNKDSPPLKSSPAPGDTIARRGGVVSEVPVGSTEGSGSGAATSESEDALARLFLSARSSSSKGEVGLRQA